MHTSAPETVLETLVFSVALCQEERFLPHPQDDFTTLSWVSTRSLNHKRVRVGAAGPQRREKTLSVR